MKRLHRLTSLLIKLQASKSIKVKDLSAEYNVSSRTIYRDLKALEDAGVPIGYEPGEDYFLLEGYQIPPIHFTSEEAMALVTSKTIVEQNSDASLVTIFSKAVEKIIAVLHSSNKKNALLLKERLAPSISKPTSSNNLMQIQEAIANFRVLDITYTNAQLIHTQRNIEPLALYFTQNHWILVAYCRLKKAHREFRLDRIKKLTTIQEQFPPNTFSLNHYFKKYQ